MRKTKRRFEMFHCYEHTAICEHLEKMAAKGWMLEKIGDVCWTYRRVEPTKLHFSVAYSSKDLRFAPVEDKRRREFDEYCAADGWKLACQYGILRIFYNEAEDPTPMETDAVTWVETIHKSIWKHEMRPYIITAALFLFNLMFYVYSMFSAPIYFFSSATIFYSIPLYAMAAAFPLMQICFYYSWRRKAKAAAETGVFAEIKTSRINHLVYTVFILMELLWLLIVNDGLSIGWQWYLAAFSAICIIAVIVSAVRKHRQKEGYPQSSYTARMVAFMLVIVLAFTFAPVFVGFWGATHGHTSEGTYVDSRGAVMEIYSDPLPLYIEDLIETEQKEYSTEADRDETVFLADTWYSQNPITKEKDVPGLMYRVVEVKRPFLYDRCKNELIDELRDETENGEGEAHDYCETTDAAPWGANEAYRQYRENGYKNSYLLCYDDCLIEITFDWEPTTEQMAVFAEKFA